MLHATDVVLVFRSVDYSWLSGLKTPCLLAGMQKLVEATPVLSQRQEFAAVRNLSAIDVISCRLWFDRRVNLRFPANVLAGFEGNAGGTFFDLNTLQVDIYCG